MRDPAKLPSVANASNITLSLRITSVVAAVVAVFYQDLAIVINDALQSDFMSYVLVIPFIFIYLLYRKRKMLRAVIPNEAQDQPRANRYLIAITGILVTAAAILLYWHGSHTFTPLEYHMLALPIFVTGLTLIFFNGQTLRQLAFPIAFLIFLMPPPQEILNTLGSTLSVMSSRASYSIANLFGIPSTLTSEYGTPVIQITRPGGTTISFAVDIACSGIYSLFGFLIFSVFVAFVMRDKPWKKLMLFMFGFLLIYALNIARITTILVMGYHYGEDIALQLFHLLGGWVLIFIGTFLLLVFAERVFHARVFTKPLQEDTGCIPKLEKGQEFCLECGKILKPARIRFQKSEIIKTTALIVAVILLIYIQTPTFAMTTSPAQIIIQTPTGEQGNTELLPQVQGYTREYIYRDREFERISRQDASLVYAYSPSDKSKDSVWVTFEIGSATSMLHPWEFCLISWPISIGQAAVNQLSLKDVQILQNPPIIARYFAFEWPETNQTQVVLYWFENSMFMIDNTTQQKRVKISLITYPESPQSITPTEDLLPFAVSIAKHWQPIKMWSEIALFLSQQSIYLVAATTAFLPIVLILFIAQRQKQVRANAKAYQKLSATTKKTIDLVIETEKTTNPTLHAISSTYKDRTGDSIGSEELLQKLSEVEKTGITKSEIANVYDEPTRIWRSQLNLLSRRPHANKVIMQERNGKHDKAFAF